MIGHWPITRSMCRGSTVAMLSAAIIESVRSPIVRPAGASFRTKTRVTPHRVKLDDLAHEPLAQARLDLLVLHDQSGPLPESRQVGIRKANEDDVSPPTGRHTLPCRERSNPPRTQRAALLLRLLPDESSRVPRRGGGVSPSLRRAGPCRLRAAAARAGLDASTCGPEYRAARADHKWRPLDCCRCMVFRQCSHGASTRRAGRCADASDRAALHGRACAPRTPADAADRVKSGLSRSRHAGTAPALDARRR